MVTPRDGEMNFKELDELAFYYMFINACLSEQDHNELKDEWNNKGGVKYMAWWMFIRENTKVGIDLK